MVLAIPLPVFYAVEEAGFFLFYIVKDNLSISNI